MMSPKNRLLISNFSVPLQDPRKAGVKAKATVLPSPARLTSTADEFRRREVLRAEINPARSGVWVKVTGELKEISGKSTQTLEFLNTGSRVL